MFIYVYYRGLQKKLISKNINLRNIYLMKNKHVEMLEANVDAAGKNNILGTLSIIKSLNKNIKNLIVISTDKAAKPINILGITKDMQKCVYLLFTKN